MISHFDHIVITVTDIERSVNFYESILLMTPITFSNGRRAMKFGNQKINLQLLGQETRNKAGVGSADICLISNWTTAKVIAHLQDKNIRILEGPVEKSGANGIIISVYINDPDLNLIEISNYKDS
ncbi:catechol 2,3-dioxygenase-like lactoylglutathione lyase family enzyme [Pedobacter cryoconitis]|uniref:Catechol 2,3-dioxygenase-like lactoylglutathione lyase family enzyme n=1 Tax=Pedobacter cryoconitis TaxID=188932 RepID=A0A7W8YWK7_9SPHI|nr:VOC family protein [Pedobacter cryoconitis]MBB5622982.1 catechol 2,3-dioxygenase-like lactoylglutathione lyase family enzyme [Pedobacter cryoconitis]MBB5644971.1 catechol 2,3-dioxygenase-like lactoylglutathione lyase family enzyme [Pedobacter cryoconitis]